MEKEGLQLYYKTTPAMVFFCKFCLKFKDTHMTKHLWTAAYKNQITEWFSSSEKIVYGKANTQNEMFREKTFCGNVPLE